MSGGGPPALSWRQRPGVEGEQALARLGPAEASALAWAKAAHAGQRPPAKDWSSWVFLGGRGAGKTRAGAEWAWATAEALGPGGRIALVGPTLHDCRTVMVEGTSGLLGLPWRDGAMFEPSLRRVRFPGGAVGQLLSAAEPERLRGPQFHAAWADEVCAWRRAEEALALLRMGVRLGSDTLASRGRRGGPCRPVPAWRPRLVVTTTPKPRRWLRALLAEPGCVRTAAATTANPHLAPGFAAAMVDLYGGTRRAAQELGGELLETEGALFTAEMMARARAAWGAAGPGRPERVVVAVDPPAGTASGRPRDACGIVAVGRTGRRFATLADRTAWGLSPEGWAGRVRRTAEEVGASRVVVEANQGGAMVEAVPRAAGVRLPVRRLHATWARRRGPSRSRRCTSRGGWRTRRAGGA